MKMRMIKMFLKRAEKQKAFDNGDLVNSILLAICHPGYSSRRKRHRKSLLALEPCITCEPGFYQPNYDQTECISCPENMTTIGRGASSVEKCLRLDEIDKDPCKKDPCHNGGTCLRIGHDFSCKCAGEFIGK